MGDLHAQKSPLPNVAEELWPLIETQLDQQTSDTAFHFILSLVRKQCSQNYKCLYQTYDDIRNKLERERFNLYAAVYVCEEILSIAQQQQDLDSEALAYTNLGRYHNALGNERLSVFNRDKAFAIYKKTGNQYAIIRAEMAQKEQSLSYRKLEEVLPEMDALLLESIEKKDTQSIIHLLIRILEYKLKAKRYKEVKKHIEVLENISFYDPSHYNWVLLNAALGRASLEKARNNIEESIFYYKKTLGLARAEPDWWIVIHVLQTLANLEYEQGNLALAKSYIDEAQVKAIETKAQDLLVTGYALQMKIAESEDKYAEALEYLKKHHFHKETRKNRSNDFDLQRHLLKTEKEALAAEKEKKEFELKLKETQLKYLFIIIILAVLLVIGLFIGFFRQRKGKLALAQQNKLIQQQTTLLKTLDVAKSHFFANISHELRTPLSLILGPISSLLKDKNLSEMQLKMIKMISNSGQQLQYLVKEILDLRKFEMGKMELEEKPTELNAFFEKYLAQFEPLAEIKKIDFSYKIRTNQKLVVNIDREKCRQIIYNLLSNAFKFTPSEGWVKANLKVKNNNLQLLITDSGRGIHPDDLPYLFDRFFQTNQRNKAAEGGTGIGLSLCYQHAKLFGGNITVKSTLGKGSTFTLRFPVTVIDNYQSIAEAEIEKTDALEEELLIPIVGSQKNDDSSPSIENVNKTIPLEIANIEQKPTILIVEDNLELQEYIKIVLSNDYSIITAENGQEALQELAKTNSHPSLILSDLMMPIMDGFQLLEKLKSKDATRHIPVIMLTARADAKDKLKALRFGVDDYLIKPFIEEELLVRIANLLKNQAMRQTESVSAQEQVKPGPALSEGDQSWLEGFEQFTRDNLSSELLSVPSLASVFTMSESTLLRQLKRLTGLSALQYLQEIRLDKARTLLEKGTYNSIAKVASAVGYSDSKYFARAFKKHFGKLPSDYKII